MDGSSNSGILLSSAKRGGGGGGSGGKNPIFQNGLQLFTGPNGSNQRNWQFTISPLVNNTNALTVQYKKDGVWQIASVYTAREQNQ
jgi:hypothetical protein